MRRSKSNPAKYARNYRKISQRKMTEQDMTMDHEEEEIQRLKNLLKTSTAHLAIHVPPKDKKKVKNKNDADELEEGSSSSRKRNRNKNSNADDDKDDDDANPSNSILEQNSTDEIQYTTDRTELILPSTRKKKPKSKTVELTPEELKSAKAKHKALQRKLHQIEQRHERKKRRTELYATLSEHAISETERNLMVRSADMGKRVSKKEMLKKLLQRERAGIVLTEEEKELLYTNKEMGDDEEFEERFGSKSHSVSGATGVDESAGALTQTHEREEINEDEIEPLAFSSSGRKKKKKKLKNKPSKSTSKDSTESANGEPGEESTRSTGSENSPDVEMETKNETRSNVKAAEKPNFSFAAQMMAGLSTLKTTATETKKELDIQRAKEEAELEKKRLREEEEERKKRKVYVPEVSAVLKCPAVMGMTPAKKAEGKDGWRVLTVNRPEEVSANRYNLPVSTMEYEIIDSIRNHSVTIICSETGSGKSTQVPQFLYESGVTLGNARARGEDDGLLICVTQPRRVAAISTAKRVCYEMGHSKDKGQTIQGKRGEGNTVAYQTKYETAGLGPKTRIKFMTDGILLQEIKSDLLLRKYAVICLDEIHERGINTDVLLGLLSAALPLRRKAALEGSLPPLKLVLMSATLRVEDFTGSGKLFIEDPPNVVRVPGRTFPVTIHHSKTTELDDYEKIAFQKVCKIHRKLPEGGILVFLTGKQEIVRMVKRLRKSLVPKSEHRKEMSSETDVEIQLESEFTASSGPRDLDDDEADGDLFQMNDNDDYDEAMEDNDTSIDKTVDAIENEDDEDNIPKKVKILPLYSLLSVKDQAKVFASVEEGTRLIVVSTNIAETSLTIPGISYVVDTGRQKCRNYHAQTGVASYDVMWISKASADQRAGRAGRTGPGHCYRTFSSSVYSRHLDDYALPEMLSRPLEDVVLAMKSMSISNVAEFPFPTSPNPSQLEAAVQLLANIGCVNVSNVERDGGDGVITRLGAAISQLPVGVRYGKMLLIAAQANVLDYGIVMVSVLSESSPFSKTQEDVNSDESDTDSNNSMEGLDGVDRTNAIKQERRKRKQRKNLWRHDGGDVLAGMLATGAYSYAGRGAGGASENVACRKFCEENNLNPVIMQRIQKMRIHLAKLSKQRLGNATGVAASSGRILSSMSPPKKLEESLLKQAIAAGLLDNIARRSPQARLGADGEAVPRSAYFSCRSSLVEPLFIDKNSVLYSRDPRQLPEWICYDTLVRKEIRAGTTISTMKNVTPIDPQWLGAISMGCKLLSMGEALDIPVPKYDSDSDSIMCSVLTKFGSHGWILPSIQIRMGEARLTGSKQLMPDDEYRWFARYLLEGKVFADLKDLRAMLNDDPSIITRRKASSKVALLISSLADNEIASSEALTKHWVENDSKFLFKHLRSWVKKDKSKEAKKLWIDFVKKQLSVFQAENE